ncbi:MAG: phosphate ABC transporter substrate-binding protein [Barnesiella sp.]|nr:phosphate ABC transporter substrate-binding protein [Bacteroidales bacterium]MBD5245788.1 phosphate ABC transporter substrate-binding protein [Barnesiella sp.]MBD5248874.1 phosphate ABC transporter substrate-binding protein [Barnesiella sp.]
MKHLALKLFAAAALLTSATACQKYSEQREGNTSTSGLTTVMCDNSFENIIQQEIDVYEYCYPKASVIPYYIPENAAIDSLLQLKTRLAVITRELTKDEMDFLKGKKRNPRCQRIAVDAIALIVNPANPIEKITRKEIAEILSGEVTDWNDLEPNKTGKISVLFDDSGSSTVAYMRDSLLMGKKFGENVFAQGSNKAVFEGVKNHKGAIGVIGVSWVASDLKSPSLSIEERVNSSQNSDTTALDFNQDIKVLKVQKNPESVEFFKPYQAYIYSGEYPLYRSIYMVCASVPGTTAHGFFSFVTGYQGQKIIQMTGVLPALVHPRLVEVN